MPYILLIDHVQVRINHAIEPAVHLSKADKLYKLENNISSASNNLVRLILCPCCATTVVNLNNYVCSIRRSKTIFCCLQNRQKLPPAHYSNPSTQHWEQNESFLDKAQQVNRQSKPNSMIQTEGTTTPSNLAHTTSLPNASNHNHVVITKENQFNAWKVLLEGYERFPFHKQIKIYNHIIEHLTELTLPATKQLVDLLKQLILKKGYECPTSHRMEEMYMAAYKSLEKKV
jgi:hypothetical protein